FSKVASKPNVEDIVSPRDDSGARPKVLLPLCFERLTLLARDLQCSGLPPPPNQQRRANSCANYFPGSQPLPPWPASLRHAPSPNPPRTRSAPPRRRGAPTPRVPTR